MVFLKKVGEEGWGGEVHLGGGMSGMGYIVLVMSFLEQAYLNDVFD
jgi:hypothetical protein